MKKKVAEKSAAQNFTSSRLTPFTEKEKRRVNRNPFSVKFYSWPIIRNKYFSVTHQTNLKEFKIFTFKSSLFRQIKRNFFSTFK